MTKTKQQHMLREDQNDLADQLKQKEKEKTILLSVGNNLAAARHRKDLLHVINDQVVNLLGGQYYTLCLINEDQKTHSPFLHSRAELFEEGTNNPIIHKSHPIKDGIFNVAKEAATPVVFSIDELVQDPETPAYMHRWFNMGMHEMMVTKIMNAGEVKGVLYFYSEYSKAFHAKQFDLLNGIAAQIGTGICNILANEKIEEQLKEISQYKQQLEQENEYLIQENNRTLYFDGLIGNGKEMQKVFQLIDQVNTSDTTVLISGETGTGKELVARAIHRTSLRANQLMIKVNCATLPEHLIESELFGHEKGSFPGAIEKRIGKFELAHKSILFLDEIAELPLSLQGKLLRVLQEKEIDRIGGNRSIKVDVRILAATNKNLQKEVEEGRFRKDLYYRLNVFPIILPPLRKRIEDIPLLALHFIEKYTRNGNKKVNNISKKALQHLCQYTWPGNVRELENIIERSVLLAKGNMIRSVGILMADTEHHKNEGHSVAIRSLEDIERAYILQVLTACNGRISGPHGAALKLALPHTTLISKMKKLRIKKEHFIQQDQVE